MERIHHYSTQDPWASLPRILVCGHSREGSHRPYARAGHWAQRSRSAVFQLTLAGSGFVEDSTGIHTVTAGQAFLMHLPDRHLRWWLDPAHQEGWEFLWLRCAGGGCEGLVDELVVRGGRVHSIDLAAPAVARWRTLALDGLPPTAPQGAALIWELLGLWASGVAAAIPPEATPDLPRKALEFIQRAATVPADVRALADGLHVSREHLSRTLTHHLGRSPRDLLAEERLRRAQILLTTTTQPNRAIATAIGLSSGAQLVRLMRRSTGMSPAEFRRG